MSTKSRTDASLPALSHVTVVLLGTKRPVTIGMVARACASFEIGKLVLVCPRVGGAGVLQKSAMRSSKGALQHSMAGGLVWMECASVEVCKSCCCDFRNASLSASVRCLGT